MKAQNNIFSIGDPVLHSDMPDIPLMIISQTTINNEVYYLIEKIGRPQHPNKLMLTSSIAYKSFWGSEKSKQQLIIKKLNNQNYGQSNS